MGAFLLASSIWMLDWMCQANVRRALALMLISIMKGFEWVLKGRQGASVCVDTRLRGRMNELESRTQHAVAKEEGSPDILKPAPKFPVLTFLSFRNYYFNKYFFSYFPPIILVSSSECLFIYSSLTSLASLFWTTRSQTPEKEPYFTFSLQQDTIQNVD